MSHISFKDLVLYAYLVFCAVPVVSGLQCLECEEVYNPVDCSLVGTCGRDEICNLFNQSPSHVIVGRDVNEAICRQCCEENYCNSMLCRETLINRPTVHTSPVTTQPKVPRTSSSTTLLPTTPRTTVKTISAPVLRDCVDYRGNYTSGVYRINPDGLSPFNVYCDMKNSSGWIVIQRRFDGSVNFNQTWESYKKGFGSLDGEFWLGNEYLHRLTSVPGKYYTLKFDIKTKKGTEFTAYYDNFTVGAESEAYRLVFTYYHGDAGDDLRFHDGRPFSTPDKENTYSYDQIHDCAKQYQAGWWYYGCYQVLLNGVYGTPTGMFWYSLRDLSQIIASTMSISSEQD